MEKDFEREKLHAEIANLVAETTKFVAESEKYRRESRWLPLVTSIAFVAVIIGVSKWIL